MSVDLKQEVFDELKIELQNEPTFTDEVLELKVKKRRLQKSKVKKTVSEHFLYGRNRLRNICILVPFSRR